MSKANFYVPYSKTSSFSPLVNSYVNDSEELRSFYKYSGNKNGLDLAIAGRKLFPVDRQLLNSTLNKQYANLQQHSRVSNNIIRLLSENTFTVCTAHQPNLLTGYLYFIYKIVHAIKLADELNTRYPTLHFVPIYYMGSEDNDLEELGTFNFRGEQFVWDGDGQTGAVGRMNTKSLKNLLDELFRLMGPPGTKCDDLQQLITNAYLKHDSIADATFYLVNELFGRFGLLVLNPDSAALKRAFVHVIKEELIQHTSYPIVSAQIKELGKKFKIQANPREINLFYLGDQLRERIENKDGKWVVVNTTISWSESELLNELDDHPERFSPNVVLRAVFQETVLPDVAFIGGGAEVAYWLQLKTLFEHYHVFYPCLLLRQSVQLMNAEAEQLRATLGYGYEETVLPVHELNSRVINDRYGDQLSLDGSREQLTDIYHAVALQMGAVDNTLSVASAAAAAKSLKILDKLEKKILAAAKRNEEIKLNRILKLKKLINPRGGLQERTENFLEPYLLHGTGFIDDLYNAIQPLRNEFLIIGA